MTLGETEGARRSFSIQKWLEKRREQARVSGEKGRFQTEAMSLAAALLKIPRRGGSVLHEQSTILPDGMRLHAVLCNTANARSLKQLERAKHGADRIEISVTGATDPQSNYGITFHFRNRTIEYSAYQNNVRKIRVFPSPIQGEGYAAFMFDKETPFDSALQLHVYRQSADIFHGARMALA